MIDWEAIARKIGDITPNGETWGGTPSGRRALEIVVGEENLRGAVDYWISQKPGCFTAEMVLAIMSSKVAMDRCYEIYKTERGTDNACSAVFLLGSFAHDEALPWISEFLDDASVGIRLNGLRVLQRVIYGPLGDKDSNIARELFDKAESDPDPAVQERVQQIRSHLPPHQDHLR